MLKHRFHRQLGLVDQNGIEKIKLCISGLDSVTMALLTQLESMGAATNGGEIILLKSRNDKLNDNSHNWAINITKKEITWKEVCTLFRNKGMNISCGSNKNYYHLNCNSPEQSNISANLFATHWPSNAVLSKTPLRFNKKYFLTPHF